MKNKQIKIVSIKSVSSVSIVRIAFLLLLIVSVFSGCSMFNGVASEKNSSSQVIGEDGTITSSEMNDHYEITLDRTTFSQSKVSYPYNLFAEYQIAPGDMLDILFTISRHGDGAYKIAVNDMVSVKFPNNPELNEQQKVRPDGIISLPYLGDIVVKGKTTAELTEELKKAYSTVLRFPELYIVIPDFGSKIKELKKDLHTASRGLSRLVTVRPDGYVTFPMIGGIFVANKTIKEVDDFINEEYRTVMPGLGVNLFLEKHAGTVVYVMGEVRDPGAFKIAKPISVLEAIARAGGELNTAKLENVFISRRVGEKIIATRIDVGSLIKGKHINKDKTKFFFLQPDDIVYVPKTWLSRTAQISNDIADILFFRGWGGNISFGKSIDNVSRNSETAPAGQEEAGNIFPVFTGPETPAAPVGINNE